MYSDAPKEFIPSLNVCEDNWSNAGEVINSGIQAVRDVLVDSDIKSQIILHIVQPENVQWWFEYITSEGQVSDFDIIGISYYTAWSDTPLDQISDSISDLRDRFEKEVMIVEAAYPWTLENADDYNNIFGEDALEDGYPATKEGQRNFMIDLTKQVINGGGSGLMYWEPAWITSGMKDRWGTGSSWENNVLFNFEGNTHIGFVYMEYDYEFNE